MCKKLWQVPKEFIRWEDEVWFHGGSKNRGLGKNPLGEFMSNLSKTAGLVNRYTNHSVRATCITVLDTEGFEARDIMSVSSHKSEQTIKSYSKTSDGKKRKMSETLSSALVSSPPKAMKLEMAKENVSCTESVSTVNIDANCNNNNSNNDDNLAVIRELLELTPDQEKEFFNDILSQEMEMPVNVPQTNVNNVSNVQNMPMSTRVLPKMMFANNNITINFNFK